METDLVLKFLKHLIGCTEEVMQKDEIESQDITKLRRELIQLERHIDGDERIDPRVLDRILALELNVNTTLLDDSRKGLLVRVLGMLFHRSPAVMAAREHRLEQARREIAQFRDELDSLRFSLEF